MASTWWVNLAARAVEMLWHDTAEPALKRARTVASLIAAARNHAMTAELEQHITSLEERLREMESAARHGMHYRSAAEIRDYNKRTGGAS